jgi:hypothetical protein
VSGPKKAGPGRARAEDLAAVERAVKAVVRRSGPRLTLQTKWGARWYTGTDLVLCCGAFSRHVGIEFWRGSTIPDPHGLLEGTGKNLRHVKVRTVAEATSPELAALVRAAIRLDRSEKKRTR